jgi:hypothetical protein
MCVSMWYKYARNWYLRDWDNKISIGFLNYSLAGQYLKFQDYAIETPLEILPNSEGRYEVQIKFDMDTPVAAINFVLKVLAFNYCIIA